MPRFTAFEDLLEEEGGGRGELILLAKGKAELREREGEFSGTKGGLRFIVINASKFTLQLIKGQSPDAVLDTSAPVVSWSGDRLVHCQSQILGGEGKGKKPLA